MIAHNILRTLPLQSIHYPKKHSRGYISRLCIHDRGPAAVVVEEYDAIAPVQDMWAQLKWDSESLSSILSTYTSTTTTVWTAFNDTLL